MIPQNSRFKLILELAKGKSVLDIGCAGKIDKNMPHKELARVASRLVGLDINIERSTVLIEEGYDVRIMSVDEAPFDLGEKFDLIVAGATIEHLYNLRIFVDNVRRHLNPDGIFIGTTHNPQAFEFFLECCVYRKALCRVRFHAHWQSEVTLKYLFETCGLRLESIKYLHQFARSWRGKIYDILFFWLPPWFSRTMIFTARLNDKV